MSISQWTPTNAIMEPEQTDDAAHADDMTVHANNFLAKWSSLVLSYASHHRVFRLSVSSAAESDLFHNRAIDRRLGPADVRDLLDFMRKEGRAESVNGGSSGGSGSEGDVVFLYWKTLEEWAALIESYVEETGQKGKFHGIDTEILLKALNLLVKKGKAQIFGSEDSLGVKFF
ncbi:Vacuolar protein-sorting-associated protein 25 [Cladobotryum mycophilum]|uniref:Vacuolar protein-sorting-associated protein 25 n=1 Tax=Cladobotryum mycophilum TaxID=491253 RepID=A0ABR0STR9_9HYPO